jgi:hypothetical protein
MLIFFALACAPLDNPAPVDVIGAQLESLTVTSAETEGSGVLASTVDGAEVSVSAPFAMTIHSPAHTDLTTFNDLNVEVRVLTDDDGYGGQPALQIADTAGLLWLAEPGLGSGGADELFGEGFATHGEALGEERRGDYIVTFTRVVFQTDDGEVEATAGAPVALTLGGQSYRATVLTAYTAEQAPGTPEYDCMGKPPLLAYELVRVAEVSDWEPVVRPDTLPAANVAGCGESE